MPRKSRKKDVRLPNAGPGEKLKASKAAMKSDSRARIHAAGMAVVAGKKWPTFELVLEEDASIKPATLGRNSSALDEARRVFMQLHGSRPGWDPETGARTRTKAADPPGRPKTSAAADAGGGSVTKAQFDRVLDERDRDRAAHGVTLQRLADAKEMVRRMGLGVRKLHAVFLNEKPEPEQD